MRNVESCKYLFSCVYFPSVLPYLLRNLMMLFYEYGDFFLYKHRVVDRLGYRNVHRVGFRDVDVVRD
jgi:hypothetical protein